MIKQIDCDFIENARPMDKALLAEAMTNSRNRLLRCETCERYHVWIPATNSSEWTVPALVRREIISEYYVQVGPNSYLHKGIRKHKARKDKSSESEDD